VLRLTVMGFSREGGIRARCAGSLVRKRKKRKLSSTEGKRGKGGIVITFTNSQKKGKEEIHRFTQYCTKGGRRKKGGRKNSVAHRPKKGSGKRKKKEKTPVATSTCGEKERKKIGESTTSMARCAAKIGGGRCRLSIVEGGKEVKPLPKLFVKKGREKSECYAGPKATADFAPWRNPQPPRPKKKTKKNGDQFVDRNRTERADPLHITQRGEGKKSPLSRSGSKGKRKRERVP